MKKSINLPDVLNKFYIVLLGVLYGMTASSSVLGVLGLFCKPYSLVLPVITSAVFIFWLCSDKQLYAIFHFQDQKERQEKNFDWIFYFLSFILIVFLIVLPVIRWPASITGDWFAWDAGLYHFPKAVEMYRTGSANDLSIAYGEYPFGYESLLAVLISITGNTALFGWLHAFIDLFFILSLWLLACRLTNLRPSISLFLIICMIFSGAVYQFLNIWQVFLPEIYTVGKNDLLLAASMVSALAFFPIKGRRFNPEENLLPFGMASMLALSVKPNSALVLGPLWAVMGIHYIQNRKKSTAASKQKPVRAGFILMSCVMLPGMLWLIRNIWIQGEIFSPQAMAASKWSIAANLKNPFFYEYIPKNFIALLAFTLLFGFVSLKKNHIYRWQWFILVLLEVAFIFTPVTAFFLRTDVPTKINWRFGEAMLGYVFVLILILLENPGKKIIKNTRMCAGQALITGFSVILTGVFLILLRDAFAVKPENDIILRDQFRQPVGVDGYYSAYDYVQKNVRSSVVWVENGLPYYAYDPDFSNSVTRRRPPDYILVIKHDWFGEGGGVFVPSYFPENWIDKYQVIYEDPQGAIFTPRN